MTMRLASLSLLALLVCTGACKPEDDDGDEAATETETASETDTQADTETDTAGETEEKPCGVGVDVCCALMDPCEADEDCCDANHTCYLVGATTQCADLAALCQQCMTGCEGMAPPEVCEMSCMVFCNPMP